MKPSVYIKDLANYVGKEVTLYGWLYNKRSISSGTRNNGPGRRRRTAGGAKAGFVMAESSSSTRDQHAKDRPRLPAGSEPAPADPDTRRMNGR